jgi:hypothetical protein
VDLLEREGGPVNVTDDGRYGRPPTVACVEVKKETISISGTIEESVWIKSHPK